MVDLASGRLEVQSLLGNEEPADIDSLIPPYIDLRL